MRQILIRHVWQNFGGVRTLVKTTKTATTSQQLGVMVINSALSTHLVPIDQRHIICFGFHGKGITTLLNMVVFGGCQYLFGQQNIGLLLHVKWM